MTAMGQRLEGSALIVTFRTARKFRDVHCPSLEVSLLVFGIGMVGVFYRLVAGSTYACTFGVRKIGIGRSSHSPVKETEERVKWVSCYDHIVQILYQAGVSKTSLLGHEGSPDTDSV
jgi:hypothetical protein